MTPVELMLSKLPDAKRNGKGWYARCPAHDDRRPSLSIAEGDDGRALVNCHAGCTPQAIVEAVGLNLADVMPANGSGGERRQSAAKAVNDRKPGNTFATASEAVAVLQRKHGQPSATWRYENAEGQPVGFVIRWDKPNGKDVRPVSRTVDGRWTIGGMMEPRPLYRLPDLLKAQSGGGGSPVYVTEGEKAADAARAVGLIATTSAHGSKSASKADWSPLAASAIDEVVILPDADDAGERYADDVAGLLAKLNPAATVKVVRLPDLPFGEGGDMADFVALRGGDAEAIKAEVKALADSAEAVTATAADNPTQPKVREAKPTQPRIEPFQPFPVDALPQAVAGFVSDSAEAIGCDASFIALPLLVGFASAIGNSRRVQLKRGWTEPAILWGAIIGESGSTKSPALELALRAVRERQRKAMREHAEAMRNYEVERLNHERELTAWKRSKAAGDPPEAPEAPTCERCWTDDATIEALAKLLQDNPRGMLVIRDELAGWLHFDRYTSGGGGKGGEAPKWLEMFGGRALVVDRKTSGTIYVPQAAVSIVGGIQPGILARYVGQEHRDNGLLARLLLTMPPRRPKVWTEADIDPMAEAGIAAIFEALHDLEPANNADGEPRPAIVQLTAEGKRDWIAFYDEHNAEAADLCGDLAAAWSKLEGYAARFALVHHLIRQVSPGGGEAMGDGIDAVSIAAGEKLSRWFAHEAKRVYAMLAEDDEARQRRQMVELIERKGGPRGSVTVREWQRTRSHHTAEDAEAELAELVMAGVGRWEEVAPGPKGGRPSKRFILADAEKGIRGRTNQTPSATVPPADDDHEAEEGFATPDRDTAGPDGDDDWGEL